MLDKRLKAVSDFITPNGVLCDVGTDHCSLPIYLVGQEKIEKAYAVEITETNLLKAKKNIDIYNSQYNAKLNIIPVLSDGLKEFSTNKFFSDITDISIAGMGGENIVKIIKDSDIVKNNVNLVLQANSKVELLRKFLYNNSYIIKKETLVYSANFLYVIIVAKYEEDYMMTKLFSYAENSVRYLMGEYLNRENSEYYDMYRQKTISRLEKILEDLNGSQKVTEFGTQDDVKCTLSLLKT